MEIDRKLIEDCIKRDRKAEFELFRLCYSYLMSICIRYTRNEDRAKEVLNMGFYRILSSLNGFQQEAVFKPWARRIMINTLINEYKKEKVHHQNVTYVEEYYENGAASGLNDALSKIEMKEIYALIDQLPRATQQVFNLYFIDGFKHKEIAELLGISEGTSKWHLNHAREKLKQQLVEKKITVNAEFNG